MHKQNSLNQQRIYWQQQIGSDIPVLELPSDYPHLPIQYFFKAKETLEFDENLCLKLDEFCQNEKLTTFTTLLAALKVLLFRYTRQKDIIVGSLSANSLREKEEGILEEFINPVALRTNLTQDLTAREILRCVAETIEKALQNRDYPFENIVKSLNETHDLNKAPLFQVMMVMCDVPFPLSETPINEQNLSSVQEHGILCDLVILFSKKEGKLIITCEYDAKLFKSGSIKQILRHFHTLLLSFIDNPEQSISALPLLTESERSQLLVEWNNTQRTYLEDKCIHQLFESQVERSPDAIAVVCSGEHLTYRELNQRANCLANHLRTLGVEPEVLVGICVKRSLDAIIGLLGILKAGGAYIPLDPTYPSERLGYMLEDANIQVLITQTNLVECLPPHQIQVVFIDTDIGKDVIGDNVNSKSSVMLDNLAYVIYTSGSTGKPKGVAIKHRSTVSLLAWAKEIFTTEDLAGVLASTSICFDLSVFELFAPLVSGGKVILAENALQITTLPEANEVTLINTVPSAIAALLRSQSIPTSVRTINIAGEPLSKQVVQQIYQQTNVQRVFNLYGPTEDTTYSTFSLIKEEDSIITIGRPIANTQVYLLDEKLQAVPIGVPGELYIGGDGLARGYLNRPDLTLEKFISNPFSNQPNSRLYKTGDLARYLSDGNIEYLGRIDNQIKIRGFRIELGEIEAVISLHPAIQESVVIAREKIPGHMSLEAYIVLSQSITNSELRGFLKQKLPDYMIPAVFITLDILPLTPNGKVDRQALSATSARNDLNNYFENKYYNNEPSKKVMDVKKLDINTPNLHIDIKSPIIQRDNIRSRLHSLFASWLQIAPSEITIFTSFLEMGTDSIILLEAIRNLQNIFEVQIEIGQFFEELTN
ncbi:MAG: amino acid adenylation domain-containing protein, partial [Rhizonema sp. PD37]|nr:amino acid adenylation domain-containing protein [Rhizonema sp. PD37]